MRQGKVGELLWHENYENRKTPILKKGKMGDRENELSLPEAMDIDLETGNIYITDLVKAHLKVFNEDGEHLYNFSRKLCQNEKSIPPFCVAICSSIVYVSNCTENCISIFNTEGYFLTEFGKKGTALGDLTSPYSLAVRETDQDLFVCEFESNQRVQIFSNSCPYFSQIKNKHSPRFVRVTRDNIFVLYKNNPCLYKYNNKYELLDKPILTQSLGKNKQSQTPSSFCVDKFNNILIADWGTNLISIFNQKSQLISTISNDIECPEAVATDNKGNIVLVSFREEFCIQKF